MQITITICASWNMIAFSIMSEKYFVNSDAEMSRHWVLRYCQVWGKKAIKLIWVFFLLFQASYPLCPQPADSSAVPAVCAATVPQQPAAGQYWQQPWTISAWESKMLLCVHYHHHHYTMWMLLYLTNNFFRFLCIYLRCIYPLCAVVQ